MVNNIQTKTIQYIKCVINWFPSLIEHTSAKLLMYDTHTTTNLICTFWTKKWPSHLLYGYIKTRNLRVLNNKNKTKCKRCLTDEQKRLWAPQYIVGLIGCVVVWWWISKIGPNLSRNDSVCLWALLISFYIWIWWHFKVTVK